MAQPTKASRYGDPKSQIDVNKSSAEPADRTNPQTSSEKGSPKPETTAVVTQVTKQSSTPVNADSVPKDPETDPEGSTTTPTEEPAPTDSTNGTIDQPGESGSTDNPANADQTNTGDQDEGTSANNNGVPPPNLSDKQGLELGINEIPNFDTYMTRCELRKVVDKAIMKATETNNSRDLLILQQLKTYYFHVMSIRAICNVLLQLNLDAELPVILKNISQES